MLLIFFCFFLFFVCKKHQFCKNFLQKIKSKKYGSHICKSIFITFKNLIYFLDEDSCSGDSGGPLIKQANTDTPWFLVGVVSFGTSKCGTGTPGRL